MPEAQEHNKKEDKIGQVKFWYIRDPNEPQRVVTIAARLDNSVIGYELVRYAFAVNKVVSKESSRIDQRLRLDSAITGICQCDPSWWYNLQKRFEARYKGDQFSRKVGREKALERLTGTEFLIVHVQRQSKSTLDAITKDFISRFSLDTNKKCLLLKDQHHVSSQTHLVLAYEVLYQVYNERHTNEQKQLPLTFACNKT
jgi:hypothetical protein